jgi:hypothetical protein
MSDDPARPSPFAGPPSAASVAKAMTAIYHITHAQNLPGIIAAGGLWCDSVRAVKAAGGATVVGIAHQHIKDRRARKAVTVAAEGTLADYVPFYFAPRSPMLCAIWKNRVANYADGQEQVVHLVSTAEVAVGLGTPWCFTDGHAEIDYSKQYSDLGNLSKVDWSIMRETYWNDTVADGDRKRRRQAEFLVHKMFPWTSVAEIGVKTEAVAAAVREVVKGANHVPLVSVQGNWYY